MTTKRAARISYYTGIRKAMLKHIDATEKSIRKLEGISDEEKAKILASVNKRHVKLVKQIDDDMAKDIKASEEKTTS
jgi:ferritin-like metal-binding protein YciE